MLEPARCLNVRAGTASRSARPPSLPPTLPGICWWPEVYLTVRAWADGCAYSPVQGVGCERSTSWK
jgi:hypothetical protein